MFFSALIPIPILSADTVTDNEFRSHTTALYSKLVGTSSSKQTTGSIRAYCFDIYCVLKKAPPGTQIYPDTEKV